jgi:COP9 signalosome complex subunit 1
LFQNWSHVISYVNKALATPDFSEGTMKGVDNNNLLTGLNCAYGLAELATRKYKSAAKRFLMAQLDHCNIPDIMSTQVITRLACLTRLLILIG